MGHLAPKVPQSEITRARLQIIHLLVPVLEATALTVLPTMVFILPTTESASQGQVASHMGQMIMEAIERKAIYYSHYNYSTGLSVAHYSLPYCCKYPILL